VVVVVLKTASVGLLDVTKLSEIAPGPAARRGGQAEAIRTRRQDVAAGLVLARARSHGTVLLGVSRNSTLTC
jgi:hypothetical protein